MKALLIGIGLLPLVRLIVLGYQDDLTANPIEFITRSTGTWALVFLCLTLAITPLRRFTGINELINYRRTLGLFVFFYACFALLNLVLARPWFDIFRNDHRCDQTPIHHCRIFIFCFTHSA
jgi:methionine sulfoxide reductase heme-binding subunit